MRRRPASRPTRRRASSDPSLGPSRTLRGTFAQACTPANAADVLVVEDNEFNMEVVTTMLQQLGHNVTMAWNGSECLEMLFDANGSPFRHPEGSPRAPESTREHPRAPESTRE